MGLDDFGFPATAIANSILIKQENFGDSTKQLEESWFSWLHYNPFDSSVAAKLASLYTARLEKLDHSKDSANRQLLERKIELVTQRAVRYRRDNFTQ